MKFVLDQLGRGGERAGQLELGSRIFSTPFPLLNTRGGTLPHLTQETLLYLEQSGNKSSAPWRFHVKKTF
jgi:hypothetical protein